MKEWKARVSKGKTNERKSVQRKAVENHGKQGRPQEAMENHGRKEKVRESLKKLELSEGEKKGIKRKPEKANPVALQIITLFTCWPVFGTYLFHVSQFRIPCTYILLLPV